MSPSIKTIAADFDRIALLSAGGWDHNTHYHGFLLSQLPARCAQALEIGCGTGAFSRQLAACSDRVLALDLSPQMIRAARQYSEQHRNIEFQVADILQTELLDNQFDCVATIATLHHLPAREMFVRIKRTLKPGGTLLVLDLFEGESVSDLLTSALAVPTNMALRLLHTGRLTESSELRRAWEEHGRHDSYLTMSAVRRLGAEMLPGAVVRKHLLWRYSLVWRKPAA